MVHGDIRFFAPEEGPVTVPEHDILAAGFPCQPFSKSGAQMGVRDRTRGTLFFNILRILESCQPKVVFLENVRNIAGPRHVDTWDTIITSLRDLGYKVSHEALVFSPHLLPPDLGGSPQVRDRVFIMGVHVGVEAAKAAAGIPPTFRRAPVNGWDVLRWDLERTRLPWNDNKVTLLGAKEPEAESYALTPNEQRWVEVWDDFVKRLLKQRKGVPLPGYPLWAEEWVLTQDLKVPSGTPGWKKDFLEKNADFYTTHETAIREWRSLWFPDWEHKDQDKRWISYRPDRAETAQTGVFFPRSRRKLEWQAQHEPDLRSCILHFRPSGIRAKKPNYAPALVAITQTSIHARRARRLAPREAARLQGLPDWFEFKCTDENGHLRDQSDAATYKQLGNGVHCGAIYYALREFLVANMADLTADLRQVAVSALDTPVIVKRPLERRRAPVTVALASTSVSDSPVPVGV